MIGSDNESDQVECNKKSVSDLLSFELFCKEEVIEVHVSDEETQDRINSDELPEHDVPIVIPLNLPNTCSINKFKENPRATLEFTELEDYSKFKLVFLSLGEEAVFKQIKYVSNVGHEKLSLEDQMFLTLWKLRKNCTDYELSVHFGIDQTQVGDIFESWIIFMTWRWSKINIWPSQELVQFYIRKEFKKNFPW